jgi:hypothetical protein
MRLLQVRVAVGATGIAAAQVRLALPVQQLAALPPVPKAVGQQGKAHPPHGALEQLEAADRVMVEVEKVGELGRTVAIIAKMAAAAVMGE